MSTIVVKTIDWYQSKAQLKALALKNLGRPQKGKTKDFAAFVRSYPTTKKPKLALFLREYAKRRDVADVSSLAFISEDACLFSSDPSPAIEIILRYLKVLNTGGTVDALWCFLDEDKHSVVHFINQGGWYAEAFFLCDEDFSVLHLLEEGDDVSFLPAVFAGDISAEVAQAEAAGGVVLQTYLPRVLYALLANKSGKKRKQREQRDILLFGEQEKKSACFDNGDLL